MNLTTLNFGIFFSLVIILYYILPGRFRWYWLLISSILFYMLAKPIYILIPFIIIFIAYFGGIYIEKSKTQKQKKNIFLLSIIGLIGLLAFFKYANFITSSTFSFINFINQNLFHSTQTINDPILFDFIVPLGISFITFQVLGYLIEIYRGNHPAEKNIGHFSTYVLFFPKILMGPIERAHNFLPQLKKEKTFNYDEVTYGLKLILWGLIKKVLIADRLSIYVDGVFNNVHEYNGITLIIAVIFFIFQLYADFSGYTDIAIGLSKLLGFNLSQNFNHPFSAKSISEIWRRWHMTLSSWFVDYFYNPIAIQKRDWGKWGVLYASMLTFLILGLWHGANWTFIIFGGLQGLIIAIEFFTRKIRNRIRKRIPVVLNNILGIAYTFSFFTFTVIFVRAKSVSDALYILKHSFSGLRSTITDQIHQLTVISNEYGLLYKELVILVIILLTMEIFGFSKIINLLAKKPIVVRWGIYLITVLIICIFGLFYNKQFIYVQF